MPKEKQIYCNSRSVGRLLADVQRGALIEPEREEERRAFFDEHFDNCCACRDEMIYYANQLVLKEIADDSGELVEEVTEQMAGIAKHMRRIARDKGISFEQAVVSVLRGSLQIASSPGQSCASFAIASTEP